MSVAWWWVVLVIEALVALLWLAVALVPARRRNLRALVDLADDPADSDDTTLPAVAILCPGRNEAAHIITTLPELCQQDYPLLRVVFIDDDSDDATPSITAELAARHDRLMVVRNDAPPPDGWVGKCWAIERGWEALKQSPWWRQQRQPWVCFADADIHWHARCLRSAMRHAQQHEAQVVSILPRAEFGSVGEALVQVQLALGLCVLYPIDRAMDPKYPDTLTGGAFILTPAALYEQAGTHRAVAGEVVEDLALGRNLKAAGGRVRVVRTTTLMHCRMYEGWADLWEGLTKNAFAGLQYRLGMTLGFLIAVLLANILPPVYLLLGVMGLAAGDRPVLAAAVIGLACLTLAVQVWVMDSVRRAMLLPWWYALTLPVGSAMYSVLIVASVVHYYRGGNRWKGRAYRRAQPASSPTDTTARDT